MYKGESNKENETKIQEIKMFYNIKSDKTYNKNNLRLLFLVIVTTLLIYIIFDFVL